MNAPSTPHPLPSNRSFGRFWTIVLTLLAVYLMWSGAAAWAGFSAATGAVVLGLTIWRPQALAPLNRAWAGLGQFLAAVVNPVVMGVLYYGLLTPVGLVLKLFGRDVLRIRRPHAEKSLWVARSTDPRGSGSFKDQY